MALYRHKILVINTIFDRMYKRLVTIILLFAAVLPAKASGLLIPYRSGDLWGLADTAMNIVVTPAYDSIVVGPHYGLPYYVVCKDGRYGVISKDSVIVPPVMTSVILEAPFIIDVVQQASGNSTVSRRVYYSMKGERLFDDTIANVYYLEYPEARQSGIFILKVEHTSGRFDVVAYDHVKQTIFRTLLVNLPYLEYRLINNRLYLNTVQKRYMSALLMNAYSLTEGEEEKPEDFKVDGYYRIRYMPDKNRFVILPVFNSELDGIFPSFDFYTGFNMYQGCGSSHYMNTYQPATLRYRFINKNNRYYLVRTHILGHSGYVLDYDPYYDQKDTTELVNAGEHRYEVQRYVGTGHIMPPFVSGTLIRYKVLPEMAYRVQEYLIFHVKGKAGILSEIGAIPAAYDSIQGILWNGAAVFVVGQRDTAGVMKFGLIKQDGTIILDMEYQSIETNQKGDGTVVSLVLESNDKVRLFKRQNETETAFYDAIRPIDDACSTYLTIRDGKYGYINTGISVDPVFSFPVYEPLRIHGYQLWKLHSEGVFIGYGDSRGRQYFDYQP